MIRRYQKCACGDMAFPTIPEIIFDSYGEKKVTIRNLSADKKDWSEMCPLCLKKHNVELYLSYYEKKEK